MNKIAALMKYSSEAVEEFMAIIADFESENTGIDVSEHEVEKCPGSLAGKASDF